MNRKKSRSDHFFEDLKRMRMMESLQKEIIKRRRPKFL